MSEANLQAYLTKSARSQGVYARKVVAVASTGFPDIFLAFAGRIVLVEVKNPNKRGRLSKKQDLEINRLRAHAVTVRRVECKGAADDVINEIIG